MQTLFFANTLSRNVGHGQSQNQTCEEGSYKQNKLLDQKQKMLSSVFGYFKEHFEISTLKSGYSFIYLFKSCMQISFV